MLYAVGLAYGICRIYPHGTFGDYVVLAGAYSMGSKLRSPYALLEDSIGTSPTRSAVVKIFNRHHTLVRAQHLATSFVRDSSSNYERGSPLTHTQTKRARA